MALRELSDRQLDQLSERVQTELGRRDDARQRREAAKLARTVVSTRAVAQEIRCGKETCRCHSTSYRHGPYWYAVLTYGSGRTAKRYLGKVDDMLQAEAEAKARQFAKGKR